MERDDIAWLLVKASGLWLLVEGVVAVPDAVMTLHRWTEKDNNESLAAFLDSGIPLIAGLFLLFANIEPMLRAMGVDRVGRDADRPESTAPAVPATTAPGLDRYDWLWVALKVCGLLVAVYGVLLLPGILSMFGMMDGDVTPYLYLLVAAVFIVVGLSMLFSNAVWKLASRER